MKELEKDELMKVEGGLLPLIIFGYAVSGKAIAWGVAGAIFVAGVYVGYTEAGE